MSASRRDADWAVEMARRVPANAGGRQLALSRRAAHEAEASKSLMCSVPAALSATGARAAGLATGTGATPRSTARALIASAALPATGACAT